MKLKYKGEVLDGIIAKRVKSISEQARLDAMDCFDGSNVYRRAIQRIDYLSAIAKAFEHGKEYELDSEELRALLS